MGVKINGAIFRNVSEESEGIDTPSLLVNGQPLSGGTQLYQHIIQLEVTSEGEPHTATLRLINTSSTSLADKRWGQLIPYISATIYGIWDETPVVSIINEQDETRIICYDQWGNQQELKPNWDGEYGGFTGPDTVTAL